MEIKNDGKRQMPKTLVPWSERLSSFLRCDTPSVNAESWMLTQCNKCNADLRDSETDRYCINVDLAEFKFQVFIATALRH